MMHKKQHVFYILFSLGIFLLIILIMQFIEVAYGGRIAMLLPDGWVAFKERNILFFVQGLMLLIVIPVFILTFIFAWKYRAGNIKANYDPNWNDNPIAECIWWGIPFLAVIIISVVTWTESHRLDPYKPLVSDKKPVNIQVVALQWKWLFIYPEQNIATVNFVQFPENTPINFEITADAPMNSFWIPELGGQIYAMPKMRTQLHLIADQIGEFRGSSANLSGKGFAGMHFTAKASSEEDFHRWVASSTQSSNVLTIDEYERLAKPSENNPVEIFSLKEAKLFDYIIMKYMMPQMTRPETMK